jgi:hypothetical protein
MKKIYFVAISLGLFLMIFLSGCGGGTSYQTIRYENDGSGFLRFYTNDPKYYSYYFTCTYGSPATPSHIEAVVKKMSGSSTRAYGIVYGYQDIHNYYQVTITTTGQYAVFKSVNDIPTTILPWSYTSELYTGYDQPNTIRWTKEDSTHFSISFNGGVITHSYYDPTYIDDRYGFITYVGPSTAESLPAIPVDTRFRFSTPVAGSISFNSAQVNIFGTESIDGSGK